MLFATWDLIQSEVTGEYHTTQLDNDATRRCGVKLFRSKDLYKEYLVSNHIYYRNRYIDLGIATNQ